VIAGHVPVGVGTVGRAPLGAPSDDVAASAVVVEASPGLSLDVELLQAATTMRAKGSGRIAGTRHRGRPLGHDRDGPNT
jgi:hypothetical protein